MFFSCRLCCCILFIGTEYCCLISSLVALGGNTYEVSVNSTLGDDTTVVMCMVVAVGTVDGSRGFSIVGVTGCGIFQLS